MQAHQKVFGTTATVAVRARAKENAGKVYIVTRHAGAVEWMTQALGKDAQLSVVPHLDGVQFAPGDKVCGVLPLSWAARICADGAEVHVLTYDTPEAIRGRELCADELRALGARLVRYDVRVIA